MKLFEIFFESESIFIEAPSEHSARYRAAALLKIIGLKVDPYALTLRERDKEAA